MTDVFISHSSHDRTLVLDLAEQLKEAGFPCWVDVESIPDGWSWVREIEKAIGACRAMIVVMSEQARASEWVEREVLMALEQGKPILFMRIDDAPLPLYMINRQYIDYRKRPTSAIRRLKDALGKVWKSSSATPASTPPAKYAPTPNTENFFKYLEQYNDMRASTIAALELFLWAREHTDALTFSGKAQPAFHANLWIGVGGVTLFSVRAFPTTPAVEVPIGYFRDFPPYDDDAVRLSLLRQLEVFAPAPFPDDRADKRPNVPLAPLVDDDQRAKLIALLAEIAQKLKQA